MQGFPPSVPHLLASSHVQITHLSAPAQAVVLVWLIWCSAAQTPSQKERMTCDHLPPPLELLPVPAATPAPCTSQAGLQLHFYKGVPWNPVAHSQKMAEFQSKVEKACQQFIGGEYLG